MCSYMECLKILKLPVFTQPGLYFYFHEMFLLSMGSKLSEKQRYAYEFCSLKNFLD